MNTLILGIGQSLRSDDGAGLAAIHRWEETFPLTASNASITASEIELPGLELLNLLEGFDAAILVDAVQSTAKPGTIHKLVEADILGFSEANQSAHGWGVAETLQLARQLDIDLPRNILLIGIEGENFSPGISLSQSIFVVLDEVAQVIEDSIKIFQDIPDQ
jgi:hydrogenase maturation protease